jgi:hypothetical protein
MTETKTLNGSLKIKRNYGLSFGDVLFSWLFYGMFRMAFYRFLFPWSFFGLALNYVLLFFAISVTFRALFSPRYRYSFQTEVGTEEPSSSHGHPPESTFSSDKPQMDQMHNSTSEPAPKPLQSEFSHPPPVNKPEPNIAKQPEPDEINPPPLRLMGPNSLSKEDQVQYCSYCGVEVPSYARFCSSCGERLR